MRPQGRGSLVGIIAYNAAGRNPGRYRKLQRIPLYERLPVRLDASLTGSGSSPALVVPHPIGSSART
jgi:hypothetical protein